MNKKAQGFGIILGFFIVVCILLAIGLFIAIGASTIRMVSDIVVPEVEGIGMVGAANLTQISGYSITPLQTVINNLSWLGGVSYMLGIIFLFGLSFAARMTASKWLIGLYLVIAFLLIICSIFISNVYEDLYKDDTSFGDGLKQQVLLSYLILNSPIIFSALIFISGIILFSGIGGEEIV